MTARVIGKWHVKCTVKLEPLSAFLPESDWPNVEEAALKDFETGEHGVTEPGLLVDELEIIHAPTGEEALLTITFDVDYAQ